MNKPNISADFTIEDIHKIREYNYEMTKDMNLEERDNYYKSRAEKVREEMIARNANKELARVL